MEQSLLIFGSSKQNREERSLALAAETSDKFDTIILHCDNEGGIEAVRQFLGNLNRKPFSSKLTTGSILEAQNLTVEAQNLLLKNLEEPRETNLLMLTCPTPYSVLPTVASRCQKIDTGIALFEEADVEMLATVKNIAGLTLADKITLAENLDLEKWEQVWRLALLENLNKPKLKTIATHLRAIAKTKEFIAKRANPKLAKINLLLSLQK